MGTMVYGSGYEKGFDDRTLAHLQIVIGLKLRRHEGFFFSWQSADGHYTSIWIDPSIPIRFWYQDAQHANMNSEWLERLTLASNSSRGLYLLEEEEALAAAR
ncbi:ATP-dependent DNA ligase [Leifsonia poae]|uniref:DUF7882 family protein n=1 Tax=Leifsonia poae TaxID=110933 RepID=UPI003D667540